LNAEYSYQPIRGILATPPDCWNLSSFDWEPLQRAHTSAAAASGQTVEHNEPNITQERATDER
jgi:hypothetical protein